MLNWLIGLRLEAFALSRQSIRSMSSLLALIIVGFDVLISFYNVVNLLLCYLYFVGLDW